MDSGCSETTCGAGETRVDAVGVLGFDTSPIVKDARSLSSSFPFKGLAGEGS
jgi:hypothetical protein